VACGSKKVDRAAPASELYVGPWFSKAARYAKEVLKNDWAIMSAKYGLLDPDQVIEPYDVSLIKMPMKSRLQWSTWVRVQIIKRWPDETFVVLAGAKYKAACRGLNASYPLTGLTLGQQYQFLNSNFKTREEWEANR